MTADNLMWAVEKMLNIFSSWRCGKFAEMFTPGSGQRLPNNSNALFGLTTTNKVKGAPYDGIQYQTI